MSIAMVVKVSEGLVLGADSAATINGQIDGPQGTFEGVIKTYYNARKLMQIGDFPIGVMTWGIAQIGARTIESLVREWEYNAHWQSREGFHTGHTKETKYLVEDCAKSLKDYLADKYAQAWNVKDTPMERLPGLGIVVAGYSENQFFPEEWTFVIPHDESIINTRPDVDGNPDFGANWFGMTDAIVRLHWGRDDVALQILSERTGLGVEEIRELLLPLQLQIPFGVMPLQDAIEYAYYMLNVAIGRFKFAVGPELCGGQIDIAAISAGEFKWISKKSWKLNNGG